MIVGPDRRGQVRVHGLESIWRGISDATGLYDKVWWFAADRALDFFEEQRREG